MEDQQKKHSSMASNYVTLAQLQERWLKEKVRKQKEKEELEQQRKQDEDELQQRGYEEVQNVKREVRDPVVQRIRHDSRYSNQKRSLLHWRFEGDVSEKDRTTQLKCKEPKKSGGVAVVVDPGSEISGKEENSSGLETEKKKKKMNKKKNKNKKKLQKNEKEEKPRIEEKVEEGTESALEANKENVTEGTEQSKDGNSKKEKAMVGRIAAGKAKGVNFRPKIGTVDQTVEIEREFIDLSLIGAMVSGKMKSPPAKSYERWGRPNKTNPLRVRNSRHAGMVWVRKGEVPNGDMKGTENEPCLSKGFEKK